MASKKKGKKKSRPAKAKKKPSRKPIKRAAKAAAPKAAAAPNPWKAYADWFAQESALTLKQMRAFPAEQQNFQPHPRSSSAHMLCWTFAVEQDIVLGAINGTLRMPPSFPPPPATFSEVIAGFEKRAEAVKQAAASAKAADWGRKVQFFSGPGQMAMMPAGMIANYMLTDQIHHRGQLSVYNRMAGGRVPSIYGPSADEPW